MNKYLVLLLALGLSTGSYAQKSRKKTKAAAKPPVQAPAPQPAAADAAPSAQTLLKAAGKYATSINAEELREHLSKLASDDFGGRETGEEGQKMAAQYIADEFKRDGLVPPPGMEDYFQRFPLERKSWGDVTLKTGSASGAFLKDFYLLGAGELPQEVSLPVVFAGYGIEDGAYSSYAGLDVSGKAVVVLAGEPRDAKGNSLISKNSKASAWATDWKQKQQLAANKGAKALLIITGESQADFKKSIDRIRHWIEEPSLGLARETDAKAALPAFFIAPELGARVLQTTPEKLAAYRTEAGKKDKPQPAPFKVKDPVRLRAERRREQIETENVLGYVPGTDKQEEVVIVTAHYDHIGIRDGKVYNGADDDGSGTVAVLELAEAFARARKEGMGPRRSMLFMPVTGEEKGLLGSEYYSEHPVFPLRNTVADLNIDMIGRIDEKHDGNPNYVYLIGSDRLSKELHEINERMNRDYTRLELDYTFNADDDPNQFYFRSDHYNFAKHNIPVIFYFNGTHADYHQETDEVEKINFEKLERTAHLVFYTAWELANREERIRLNEGLEDPGREADREREKRRIQEERKQKESSLSEEERNRLREERRKREGSLTDEERRKIEGERRQKQEGEGPK